MSEGFEEGILVRRHFCRLLVRVFVCAKVRHVVLPLHCRLVRGRYLFGQQIS